MKTDHDCIFCKIVAGQMPCFKLLEDDDTLAFMDIYPANDGHCLVVAKDHYTTLFEISDEALAAVSRSVSRVARAVNQALSPVGLNLVQANGSGGPTVSGAFPYPRDTAQPRRQIKAKLERKDRRSRHHRGDCREDPRPSLGPFASDLLPARWFRAPAAIGGKGRIAPRRPL
jgi:hypothetical protein